ncbi:hypothetical protein C8Q79DRAFT_621742 [Trametes meyenii]|nr:hypothetical protein C8Q79DRAFT_621742 [Trametes meyenii]
MASSSATGSATSLSESRAQALQALLNSLSPGAQSNEAGCLNTDQVRRISDKLGEILGEDAIPDVGRRNEKGELVNEEGLPIVDIVEPLPPGESAAPSGPAPSLGDYDVLPLWTLSPAEKARRRAERERILDMLEEEERIQQEKDEAEERERFKVELEKRKAAAKAEMDALKKAREVQKKMGKALLQNMAAAREREEKEKKALEQAEQHAREERRKLKPKKSVTFADLPPDHENQPANSVPPLDWGDVAPAKLNAGRSTLITRGQMDQLPMKMQVVERVPGVHRGPKSPPPPTSNQGDSDDESEPSSPVPVDSDDGEIIQSDHSDSDLPQPTHDDSEESDAEPPEDTEPVEWDVEGYDFAQHQREIALAYYEKRATVGAEALAAMRNHEHTEEEHEWDQPVVPLDATLASSPPKSPVSRFKASRTPTSSLPSHSLGASVLPSAQSSTLKSAVRLGRLQHGHLVGGQDGESDEELDSQAREMLEALKRGDVVNAGPTPPSGAAAAPQPGSSASTSPLQPPPTEVPPASRPKPSKVSQFKMSLGQPASPQPPDSPGSGLSTPVANNERSSPKLGSRSRQGTPIIIPTKTSRPVEPSSRTPNQRTPKMPGMIVDSPSFPPSQQSKASGKRPMQMPGMIVDSPSFPAPHAITSPKFPNSASQTPSPGFQSTVIESPSFQSPSATAVGTPVSGVPASSPSPAASIITTPTAPVGDTVLERKPPTIRGVKESGPATTRATIGKEKRVSKFAAERM